MHSKFNLYKYKTLCSSDTVLSAQSSLHYLVTTSLAANMNKLVILLIASAILCLRCEGKVFTRCGLVQELRRQGFPSNQLRDCEYTLKNLHFQYCFVVCVVLKSNGSYVQDKI